MDRVSAVSPLGQRNTRNTSDWVATASVYLLTGLIIAAILLPVLDLLVNGAHALSLNFLLESPRDAGRAGGISSILVSTALIVGTALFAALPLALSTAVFLFEYLPAKGHAAAVIRGSLDVLAGVPSIVFGLFGMAFFCRTLGLGYSIAAGGLTLACMILPTLTRTFSCVFESIGSQYKFSGSALGFSRVATFWNITLPVALPGLASSVILGLTRALGETAALLFTSGYADRMPQSLLDSGRSVSVHIYELATNVPGGQNAARGSALVLLLLLGCLSWAVYVASGHLYKKMAGTSERR